MPIITLQFPSIIALVDFISMTDTLPVETHREQFVIKGIFSEADIELAIAGFNAVILEN